MVARGSHANYPTAGRREPDWTSCEGGLRIVRSGLTFLSFAAGALETTPATGVFQVPAVASIAVADRILHAPWWWGVDERYEVAGMPLAPDDHGPASPAYQPEFFDRTAAELLDDWECDAPEDACEAVRSSVS